MNFGKIKVNKSIAFLTKEWSGAALFFPLSEKVKEGDEIWINISRYNWMRNPTGDPSEEPIPVKPEDFGDAKELLIKVTTSEVRESQSGNEYIYVFGPIIDGR